MLSGSNRYNIKPLPKISTVSGLLFLCAEWFLKQFPGKLEAGAGTGAARPGRIPEPPEGRQSAGSRKAPEPETVPTWKAGRIPEPVPEPEPGRRRRAEWYLKQFSGNFPGKGPGRRKQKPEPEAWPDLLQAVAWKSWKPEPDPGRRRPSAGSRSRAGAGSCRRSWKPEPEPGRRRRKRLPPGYAAIRYQLSYNLPPIVPLPLTAATAQVKVK